jgi:hypothetical protein
MLMHMRQLFTSDLDAQRLCTVVFQYQRMRRRSDVPCIAFSMANRATIEILPGSVLLASSQCPEADESVAT